ncbi:MAG TPA: alpha/beta hydrolase [Rhizomicrobium sp.]|nr:alpha/beta hydrolase [Rhizomicrobium sp.]
MRLIQAGLLAFSLPLLLAAASVKTAPNPAIKTAPERAAAKPPVSPAAKLAPAHTPAPKAASALNAEDFDQSKTYPLQTTAFPGGVSMSEMVYSELKGFRPLTLDLYQPAGKGFPRPGLIFVHGGDWKDGDSRHTGTFGDFPGLLASLAARGYVVASINYRLSGEAHFPAALQDVKTAIRWLRGHAGDYNVDETRIAIWGASAGGHLAALAGVSCGVSSLEPPTDPKDKPPSDCVQAVIDWYGITDFETLFSDFGKPAPDKTAGGDFLGCEPALCPIAVARNASPLAYIEAMSPPFLIQHGAEDTTVSPQQSQKLYDALRAKDVPAELVIYPGVSHGFGSNSSPGAPDPATNNLAVEKLEAFLDTAFPKKPATSPYKPAKQQGLPY